ncbi:MAG: hypothetical protein ABFS22_05180 [Pseudomonadota bacterium]
MAVWINMGIIIACTLITGCAGNPPVAESQPLDTHVDTAGNPALDHFIARIPYQQATTATVARARTHVAIGKARSQLADICGGTWLVSGPIAASSGPHLSTAAGMSESESVWYYRISRRPGLRGCNVITADELYIQLRDNLPAWITLQRSEPAAAGNDDSLLPGVGR